MLRSPMTCLLSLAQPEQPLGRISRYRKLSAAALWAELRDWYADPALPRLRRWGEWPAGIAPTVVLVYDGEIAHVVRAYTAGEDQLHYGDPWPDYSLLCAGKNAAGVRARKSDLIDPGWSITAKEFQRVVFAAFLYKFPARAQQLIPLTKSESREAALYNLRPFGRMFGFMEGTPGERLRRAARAGDLLLVKLALNEGADVDEKDQFGTPLQAAAAVGHLAIVRLLVKSGADPCAPGASGKTPAQVARQKGHRAVAGYLRSLG
jgi:hypothetical protein